VGGAVPGDRRILFSEHGGWRLGCMGNLPACCGTPSIVLLPLYSPIPMPVGVPWKVEMPLLTCVGGGRWRWRYFHYGGAGCSGGGNTVCYPALCHLAESLLHEGWYSLYSALLTCVFCTMTEECISAIPCSAHALVEASMLGSVCLLPSCSLFWVCHCGKTEY
jgi:hypothetical protein